ncbi:hypothetical protein [Aequorivita sp. Q41]|uniref:hypothetical protein n=1 Tax=Aequorivita sp. Q41 TaxID=3153300 RepID=UPI003242C6A7
MKALFILVSLCMVNACKTQTDTVITTNNTNMEQIKNKTTGCPEEGTCSVAAHKNQRLAIKDDGTGALYPEMTTGNNIIVAFTYAVKGPEGTADGDYSETIHFEIPSDTQRLSKENAALADVNLLFGRHCFCRDGGYFPVTDGKLMVEKTDTLITFDLQFRTDKTSQTISHIRNTVTL